MSQRFTDLMNMEAIDEGQFRATPLGGQGFLFGGLTMGMALTAAAGTVDASMVAMSLRCSFVSFGQWGQIDVHVERLNTSRSFALRRLRLVQDEKLVAAADVAFHRPEEGNDRQDAPLPDISEPAQLEEVHARFGSAESVDPIEMRAPWRLGERLGERIHPFWGRVRQPLGESPTMHAAGLAFISDYMVIFSPFEPGSAEGTGLSSFTLEHTLWFHRPFAADRWMLFDCSPLTQSGGRYVSRGTVHDEPGELIASFVQEGFIRPAAPNRYQNRQQRPQEAS
jgi:acyl-CoA thioesterase-2